MRLDLCRETQWARLPSLLASYTPFLHPSCRRQTSPAVVKPLILAAIAVVDCSGLGSGARGRRFESRQARQSFLFDPHRG